MKLPEKAFPPQGRTQKCNYFWVLPRGREGAGASLPPFLSAKAVHYAAGLNPIFVFWSLLALACCQDLELGLIQLTGPIRSDPELRLRMES